MAVKIIQKSKTKEVLSNSLESAEFKADLDRLTELKTQMAPIEASLEVLHIDYAEIEKRVLAYLESEGVDSEKYNFTAAYGKVELSAVPEKTEITDKDAMIEALEDAQEGLFQQLASVTLTELKNYLGAKALEKFTEKFRKGKRRVKITLDV